MIGFRTHASNKIGFGHLSRCLTIARACKAPVVFWVAQPEARAVIESEGFTIGSHADVWVIDNYTLDGDDVRGAMVLDDPMERSLQEARWIVNPTPNARYDSPAIQIIGPRYAMINPAYAMPRVTGDVKRVLVTMGGSDPDDVTLHVARELMNDFALDVVVGPMFSATHKRALAELDKVTLHHAPRGLVALMKQCDMCVGAGGLSVYEFAAAGLPTLAIELVDNQQRNLQTLSKEGVLKVTDQSRLLKDAKALAADHQARAVMSQKGRALVDGQGARRVAKILECA